MAKIVKKKKKTLGMTVILRRRGARAVTASTEAR